MKVNRSLSITALFVGVACTTAAEPASSHTIHGRVFADHKAAVRAHVSLHPYTEDAKGYTAATAITRTDDAGRYRFDNLTGNFFCVVARYGDGRGVREIAVVDPVVSRNVTVEKPAKAVLQIVDSQSRPVAAAIVHTLFTHGLNGSVHFANQESYEALGYRFAPSDENGMLELSGLPASATFDATVVHPVHAPAGVKGALVGRETTLAMPEGVQVSLRIAGPDGVAIDRVRGRVHHEPYDHPSTMFFRQLPVTDGRATLVLEAGWYSRLELMHPDYFVKPVYAQSDDSAFRIDQQTNNDLVFQLQPKPSETRCLNGNESGFLSRTDHRADARMLGKRESRGEQSRGSPEMRPRNPDTESRRLFEDP